MAGRICLRGNEQQGAAQLWLLCRSGKKRVAIEREQEVSLYFATSRVRDMANSEEGALVK